MGRELLLADRFWSKVDRATGACWRWTAHLGPGGYGAFRYCGKIVKAHRLAYEWLVGPIPDGMQLDHLCRDRACVNPAHLEPVTQQENIKRGLVGFATASRQRAKTHCPRGHEYTQENTRIQGTWRSCKACELARNRAKRTANSAAMEV